MKDAEVKSAVEKGVSPCRSPSPSTRSSHRTSLQPVANLTTQQLQEIYTGKVTNWKQVGGEDKPIVAVGRDTSSGTFEVWEEKILKKEKVTPKAQVVASSGALLQTVGKNKYAIGYDGIGYADDKSVKMLTVNGVKADAKTAAAENTPFPATSSSSPRAGRRVTFSTSSTSCRATRDRRSSSSRASSPSANPRDNPSQSPWTGNLTGTCTRKRVQVPAPA